MAKPENLAKRQAYLNARTPETKTRYYANARAKRAADPGYKARQAQWRRDNREWMRADHVMRRYGLTLEQDKSLGNTCNICGIECKPEGRVRGGRCVDHNHKTGAIRGVLCRECNLGIAAFGDDPERLARAAEYLNADLVRF